MEPSQHNSHRVKEISALLKLLRGYVISSGSYKKGNDINELESSFDLNLPSDYRQFLSDYGALHSSGLAIMGLGKPETTGMPVADAIMMLRLAYPDMPLELVPIEDLGHGRYACLATSLDRTEYCPVVELDINKLHSLNQTAPIFTFPQLASCFLDYLYDRLTQLRSIQSDMAEDALQQEAWSVFEKHVLEYQAQFGYDHDKGGRLPRNHDWRPYRFCIQDVVFGSTVVRHLREGNCLQVDVFLTAEIPEYGPLAGALALTTFLLSEAYKCGGTMEIRFTKEVENGQVPRELQELAQRYGIYFHQAKQGYVTAPEAKALYAALTGFSPQIQLRISELEQIGRIKMARACYVIHHGVWTREQVEMIVLGSQYPDSILGGMAQPHQRHLYQHDLLHTRAAIMGGILERRLGQRERIAADGTSYDMEDDVRPLEIGFDSTYYAKRYQSDENIPVPWLYTELGEQQREIDGDMIFHVLVRARDTADMNVHLAKDIQQAEQLRVQANSRTFILVPYDFYSLSENARQQLRERAKYAKVGLLICPETILTLDSEAAQKLARSRVLRQ